MSLYRTPVSSLHVGPQVWHPETRSTAVQAARRFMGMSLCVRDGRDILEVAALGDGSNLRKA
jgi:hypothetical protein